MSRGGFSIVAAAVAVAGLVTATPGGPAAATGGVVRIVPVPLAAHAPLVPHPSYNGHPVTLKAIARDVPPGTYYSRWDIDGNGTYDTPDKPATCSTGTCYDLSARTMLPTVTGTAPTLVSPRVQLFTTTPYFHEVAVAWYPVLVYPDVPAQPQDATESQRAIMAAVAVDDALWALHTQLSRTGTGAAATGALATPEGTAAFALLAERWGHLPAYEPGRYDPGVNPGGWARPAPPSVAWLDANDSRWLNDPYADDVQRAINSLAASLSPVTVPASAESDDATPSLPDTNDGIGLLGWDGRYTYGKQGLGLAALLASGLDGSALQAGSALVQGHPMAAVAQQWLDGIVAGQRIAGPASGAWGYSPNEPSNQAAVLGEGVGRSVFLALAAADASSWGVHIPSDVKARLAGALLAAQAPDGQATWFVPSMCPGGEFTETADALLGAAYLGWDHAVAGGTDTVGVTASGSPVTELQAHDALGRYLGADGNGGLGGHWMQQTGACGFFSGLFASDGTATPYLSSDGQGSVHAMFSTAEALTALDVATVAGHDAMREISTWIIRNQGPSGTWAPPATSTALTWDQAYPGPHTTAYAALALGRPSVPGIGRPFAAMGVSPDVLMCGGYATFGSDRSASGSSASALVDFAYDFGDGGPVVHVASPSSTVQHRYTAPGTYTATLTVADDSIPAQTATDLRIVTVAMRNTPPVADSGGPYVANPSAGLDATGSSDGEAVCGQVLTYTWTVGDLLIATGATPTVAGPELAALGLVPSEAPYPLTLHVTDSAGASAIAATELTVMPFGQAPSAADDASRVTAGGTIDVPVVANDSDPDGDLDPSTVTLTGQPAHGTATVVAGGVIRYAAAAAFVGVDSITYTVADAGGRVSTPATVTVAVLAPPVTIRGFFAPVDMGGVWNTVKGGATVPIKFTLWREDAAVAETSAVASFGTARVACGSGGAPEDAIETVTTAPTALRYDSSTGQFIQNWKTPKTPGVCYRATIATVTGASASALFALK